MALELRVFGCENMCPESGCTRRMVHTTNLSLGTFAQFCFKKLARKTRKNISDFQLGRSGIRSFVIIILNKFKQTFVRSQPP